MPSSSKRLLSILFLFLLLGAGLWLGIRTLQSTQTVGEEEAAAAGGPPQGPPPTAVTVTPVMRQNAQNTHRVVGSLRAVSRAEVSAREEGAVTEVLAKEGDLVEKHQIITRLDPLRLEAQLAQAQANLTAARSLIGQREAEVARSKTDLAMKQSLFAQKAISQAELLDAEREATVAASQEKAARDSLAAAAAALQLLEVRKQDLVIRAPFEARVVHREAELGEWLRQGDLAFTLISSGKIEAWLQVPERFAGLISKNDVEVTAAGQTFSASNLRALPEADGVSRVLTVIADIEDPKNDLMPGLSVTAELAVSETATQLVVPNDALVTTFAGRALFRVNSTPGALPIAEQLPVTVLFQQQGRTFIECEGLQEGDLVVTSGNERLRNGTTLLLADPTTPATPES